MKCKCGYEMKVGCTTGRDTLYSLDVEGGYEYHYCPRCQVERKLSKHNCTTFNVPHIW